MSQTVRTTVEDFYDETESLYPLEKYDAVEGVYDDVLFRVKYEPPKEVEMEAVYGVYKISVFGPQDDVDDNTGGTVFYSESHVKPDGMSPLRKLFTRARKIAVQIATNDNLHKCPYCGFMVNDEWKIEKNWSMLTRRPLKRVVPNISHDDNDNPCAGMCSWLPPKVEVYKHKDDENPIFDHDELEDCESLVIAPGYPEWAYKSQLYWFTNYRLQVLLEEHPEVFKDELDVDTMKAMLDNFDKTQRTQREDTRLIDQRNLTYQEN